jgi:hypothetical protein
LDKGKENQGNRGRKRAIIALLFLFFITVILLVLKQCTVDETTSGSQKEEKEPVTEEVSLSEDVRTDSDSISNEEDAIPELSEGQKVSEDFIKAMYEWNADYPGKTIDNAKKFSSGTLAEMMESNYEQLPRATAEVHSRTVTSIKVEEPEEPSEEYETWIVTVEGELKDKEGNKTGDDSSIYLVRVEQVDGSYKAVEYVINPNL